jgi:acyl-CoA thioesterase-1
MTLASTWTPNEAIDEVYAFTRYGLARCIVNARACLLALVLAALCLAPAAGGAAEPVRLLVLGDSLAAGYGLSRQDGFTSQLERSLRDEGLEVIVINAGVSGDTSAGGLSRLDWVLDSVGGGGPDAVIVELGANDGLRGIDPDVTYGNLDRILSRLGERGLPVLLAGMRAPPNMGREYVDAFDAIFPRLAEQHGVPLYPFFLDGVAADPDLNQPDGIHPNPDGVAEIVSRITPAAKALVRRAENAR